MTWLKIRNKVFLISLFFLLLFLPSSAQGRDEIIFEHLSLEEGLSQTTVNTILKDHKGYLWFGTNGGLNRYDGYSFRVYRHEPFSSNSLSNNMVTSLYEDKNGIFWIGTFGGGLNRFDPSREIFQSYRYSKDASSPPDDLISHVIGDKKGYIWVGTFQNGLGCFDPERETWNIYLDDDSSGFSGEGVLNLYVDSKHQLWVGTNKALNFHTKRDTFIPYYAHSKEALPVTAITEGRKGFLWIGTASGKLYRFYPQEEKFEEVPLKEKGEDVSIHAISGLYEDIFEDVWIATDGGGLLRFDRATEEALVYRHEQNNPRALRDNKILSIHGDRKDTIFLGDLTGIVWLGTHSKGIEKFHLKRPFQRYNGKSFLLREVAGDNVYAIYKEGYDNLWIGTFGNGVKLISKEGETQHFLSDIDDEHSLASNRVFSIFQDKAGDIWIGTDRGLCRYNKVDSNFTTYENTLFPSSFGGSNKITTLLEDFKGTFWVGTSEGLYRFVRKAGLFEAIPWSADEASYLREDIISCLFEDSRHNLWIGTSNNGFFRINPVEGRVEHYVNDPLNSKSLPANRIFSIYEDREGVFWLGTDVGLCQFDETSKKFLLLTKEDGFRGDSIRGILEDNYRNLWISTNNGLSCYDIRMNTVRNYNLGDGLQAKEFNASATFKDSFGRMYFGGINGCNSFFSTDVWENSHVPPIVINEVLVMNKPVQPFWAAGGRRRVILNYSDKFLSIDFSALDYTHPESNQYRYKLEGLDRDWVNAGNRHFAYYTNLPPGEYTFRVVGSNNNGVWNQDGAELDIEVIPPLWKTPLAYTGYGFLLLALLWFIRKYLMNRQEKETEQRLRIVTERTNEQLRFINKKLEEARNHEETYRNQLRSLASALSMAEEKERRRIAEVVHDSIGQNLALTKIRLALLQEGINDDSQKDEVTAILSSLEESIKSTRTLTFELGSPILYRLGFAASVEWLAEKMQENYSLSILYENQGLPEEMSDELKAFLFRALHELLLNVAKHSGTDKAYVKTSYSGKMIRMTVCDEGRGFDTHNIDEGITNKQSFGLFSLRERLCSLGGYMIIKSKENKGVRITLFVPADSFNV